MIFIDFMKTKSKQSILKKCRMKKFITQFILRSLFPKLHNHLLLCPLTYCQKHIWSSFDNIKSVDILVVNFDLFCRWDLRALSYLQIGLDFIHLKFKIYRMRNVYNPYIVINYFFSVWFHFICSFVFNNHLIRSQSADVEPMEPPSSSIISSANKSESQQLDDTYSTDSSGFDDELKKRRRKLRFPFSKKTFHKNKHI